MRNNSGRHWNSQGDQMNRELEKSRNSLGYQTNFKCEVCGENKAGKSHPKCSKILQARYLKEGDK